MQPPELHPDFSQLETILNHELWQQCQLSQQLWQRELSSDVALVDYSFIVFPMAKAYEGFIKMFLLEMGLIPREVFESRRFRIGRALNPDLSHYQQDERWLFDDVARSCSRDRALQIWQTWLECRNHVFHFFPQDERGLTLLQAERKLKMLVETMVLTWACVR